METVAGQESQPARACYRAPIAHALFSSLTFAHTASKPKLATMKPSCAYFRYAMAAAGTNGASSGMNGASTVRNVVTWRQL